MKQRTIHNSDQLQRAALDLVALDGKLGYPFLITVTQGSRLRSEGQNQRHWADLQYFLEQIQDAVSQIAETTGYTDSEVRWVVAEELPIEQRAILFAYTAEQCHDALKRICNIPTSTRLGTKEFAKFDEIRTATMTEIIGSINAVKMRALQ